MRVFLGIPTFQLTFILHNHTTGCIILLVQLVKPLKINKIQMVTLN